MSWDEAVMPKFTSNAGGMRSSARHGERAPGAAVTAYERGGAWVVAAHGSYDTYSIAPLAHALDAAARKYRRWSWTPPVSTSGTPRSSIC